MEGIKGVSLAPVLSLFDTNKTTDLTAKGDGSDSSSYKY